MSQWNKWITVDKKQENKLRGLCLTLNADKQTDC